MNEYGITIGAAILTLVMTSMIVLVLLPLARHWGLVDRPGERRTHAQATPAIGGLSILLAAAPVGLWLLPLTPQVKGLGLAAVIILVVGVADDLYRIRWQYRLCGQILAALVMIYVGGIRVDNIGEIFGFPTRPLGPLSTPLTVIATVGIINAVNMADGVDGLAGTLTLVTSIMLAIAAMYTGNYRLASGLCLVAGALCGFLIFNLRTPWNPRARIFLGNAGSELLGLIIACASFRLTQNRDHAMAVQVVPFMTAPVLIDCLTLLVRRARMGVSPFVGDRNHLHHLLLDAGATPTGVIAIIGSATLVIGGCAALALMAHVPAICFTGAFIMIWALYFIATRRRDVSVSRLAKIVHHLTWIRSADKPSLVASPRPPGGSKAGLISARAQTESAR